MRTVLVTGSDTGVGKTRVVAALARLLAADGARVQIVKVVETGRTAEIPGDADTAHRLAGAADTNITAFTLATFAAPLAPVAAARAEGRNVSATALADAVRALPACDWRILEGAGGIASPIDAETHDWADFGADLSVDATVVVVPDRLGAINQARLAFARAVHCGLRAGVWLNATTPLSDAAVVASNRSALAAAGVPLWAEQAFEAPLPKDPDATRAWLEAVAHESAELSTDEAPPSADSSAAVLLRRCRQVLDERERKSLRRTVRVTDPNDDVLNLADNDYLALARDLAVTAAVVAGAAEHGTSASASPLITGWRAPHERLLQELAEWHDFPCGLLWTSGYAANAAVLGVLPQKGDLVLADRLIHHSMIAGLLRSGARVQRYEHLRLDRLEEALTRTAHTARVTFVVTESVFSMDGDFPDLARLAELKRRFGFCLVVDEAHALGWYGPEGSGQVRGAGVSGLVDVLVGTLGKTLASGGAYTLFRDAALRDFLINHAGEFIYSTALSPLNAVAASAALARVRALAPQQAQWQAVSRTFRARLREAGWETPDGDSPIVPVHLASADAAVEAAAVLRARGILAAAVRPPTVPAGTSRLRFSLKRTFDDAAATRVLTALEAWRKTR